MTGYFGSTLPLSAANMLVYGCSPHSGPSSYVPVTGSAGLLGVLGGEEHQRTLRNDPERILGDGALHGRHDLGGVRLVVNDERDELVAVHAALGVLQVQPGLESRRGGGVFGPSLAGEVGDVRNGDRRGRGPGRDGRRADEQQRQHAEHGQRHRDHRPAFPHRCSARFRFVESLRGRPGVRGREFIGGCTSPTASPDPLTGDPISACLRRAPWLDRTVVTVSARPHGRGSPARRRRDSDRSPLAPPPRPGRTSPPVPA